MTPGRTLDEAALRGEGERYRYIGGTEQGMSIGSEALKSQVHVVRSGAYAEGRR
jgi:hypothetical protein